uniref:Uncharacterized protein n=1 Tax=Phasianus colchicus TaxID=9054 RepID=A0A669QRM6_PHACC
FRPASFPASQLASLEGCAHAAALTSLCGKKVLCFLYAIYGELLHRDVIPSPRQLPASSFCGYPPPDVLLSHWLELFPNLVTPACSPSHYPCQICNNVAQQQG